MVKKVLYIVLMGLMLPFGCRKECPKCDDPTNPDCENYDPCLGKKHVNSLFRVRPGDRGFKPPEEWCDLIPCDTFNASSVRFDIPLGNPDNSTYEWQIGDEPNTRTDKGFEVDFSDYLNDGNWETFLPVTLTVRTPLNECLTNPEDTLIVVTRELFFTQKQLSIFEPGETEVSYKGYFTDKSDQEVILQHIIIQKGTFRNQFTPINVVVGLPFTDTFFFPRVCKFESCENFKHKKANIFTTLNHCNEVYDYKVEFWDRIFLNGTKKIKEIYVFDDLNGNRRFEFIGERL